MLTSDSDFWWSGLSRPDAIGGGERALREWRGVEFQKRSKINPATGREIFSNPGSGQHLYGSRLVGSEVRKHVDALEVILISVTSCWQPFNRGPQVISLPTA